eukprot:scaffold33878_cov15-Tisochrysis_lutea.AAC.1
MLRQLLIIRLQQLQRNVSMRDVCIVRHYAQEKRTDPTSPADETVRGTEVRGHPGFSLPDRKKHVPKMFRANMAKNKKLQVGTLQCRSSGHAPHLMKCEEALPRLKKEYQHNLASRQGKEIASVTKHLSACWLKREPVPREGWMRSIGADELGYRDPDPDSSEGKMGALTGSNKKCAWPWTLLLKNMK